MRVISFVASLYAAVASPTDERENLIGKDKEVRIILNLLFKL